MSKTIARRSGSAISLRCAVVFGVAALMAFVNTAPAHANPSDPRPSSPELAVPPAASPPKGEDVTDVTPLAEYCEIGEFLYGMTNTKNSFDPKYRTSVRNATSSYKAFEFSASKTGTTTYTVSISVSAELKASIFAKIQATINGGIEKSNTTTYGAKVSGTGKDGVSPNTILYGDYGNWKENVNWRSHRVRSNCTTYDEKSGSAYAPYREEWNLWETKI